MRASLSRVSSRPWWWVRLWCPSPIPISVKLRLFPPLASSRVAIGVGSVVGGGGVPLGFLHRPLPLAQPRQVLVEPAPVARVQPRPQRLDVVADEVEEA